MPNPPETRSDPLINIPTSVVLPASLPPTINPEFASHWLAALIESADDAIISKTLDGIITSWNKGAERLFGYEADEVIGKPVLILMPPGHENEEPEILNRLRRGERVDHYETVRVTKNGELLDISLTVSPIRGADGTIIGASKIARDITEIKKYSRRIKAALLEANEARKEAEQASRLKDEFLATISHELRTPLTAILGWVRLLQDGGLDQDGVNKGFETIERNTRAQAQLIEDLLDISRIISGAMRIDSKRVLLPPIINAAVDSILPAAEAKGIALQLVTDPGIAPVTGDPQRLQQVVWNLLSNAVKFTPRGGRIEVHLHRADDDVEIVVSDSGIGIDPAFLPLVFDRFAQQDSSSRRTYGGLGLGLAIVKYLVDMHGGNARVHSDGKDQGATFTITLPISDELPEPATVPSPGITLTTERVIKDVHPSLEGLKILVVDDELDTCEMVAIALEQSGCIVKTADSAVEGLAAMDEMRPDVVIADISMPRIDGFQFMKEVRARTPERGGRVPAIALSALTRIEERVQSLAVGFQMHVSKPVEPDELRAIVASLATILVKAEST